MKKHITALLLPLSVLLGTIAPVSAQNYQVSNSMVGQIQQYFSNDGTTNVITALNISFWNSSQTTSFSTTWPSSANGDFATGKRLPPEVVALLQTTGDPSTEEAALTNKLSTGPNSYLVSQQEMDGFAAMLSIYMNSIQNGVPDSLPKLLTSSPVVLPLTKRDILIYYLSHALTTSSVACSPISNSQLSSWYSLAQSTNPVFRLIALQTFALISTDSTTWPNFYTLYANETDPDLAKAAIDLLWKTSQKANIGVLQLIQQGQQQNGNTDAASYAAHAIQNLQRYGQ